MQCLYIIIHSCIDTHPIFTFTDKKFLMGNNIIRMKTEKSEEIDETVEVEAVTESDEPVVLNISPSPSQSPLLTINERLRLLYPGVDQEETPLPLAWSTQIKHYLTGLSLANRRAHYKGQACGDDSDIGCVRATHPVPPAAGIYYFEVKIISQGEQGWISVGLCSPHSFLNALTGWQDGTFGYHGDDGNKFKGAGWGLPYGPTFTTGDVIGCALNVEKGACAYTKNGSNLGVAFTGKYQFYHFMIDKNFFLYL